MGLFRRCVVVYPLGEMGHGGIDTRDAQSTAVVRSEGHNADLRDNEMFIKNLADVFK